MIQKLSSFIRSECGKAESKAPALIFMLILLGCLYWGWKYGLVYFNDFQLANELDENIKYDPNKIRVPPTIEERRDLYVSILNKYEVKLNDKDPQEWLKVERDEKTQRWFVIDLQYKVVITHPIGKPVVKIFHHKIYPK
jgi:hypothetical protein